MKNTNHTRPAPRRPTRNEHKANSFKPKTTEKNPPPTAYRMTPKAHPHDFLTLCFYPGMGDHSTAA